MLVLDHMTSLYVTSVNALFAGIQQYVIGPFMISVRVNKGAITIKLDDDKSNHVSVLIILLSGDGCADKMSEYLEKIGVPHPASRPEANIRAANTPRSPDF